MTTVEQPLTRKQRLVERLLEHPGLEEQDQIEQERRTSTRPCTYWTNYLRVPARTMRKSQGAPRSKQVEGEALDRNNPGMRPDYHVLRAALGQCVSAPEPNADATQRLQSKNELIPAGGTWRFPIVVPGGIAGRFPQPGMS
jgi:hypothetical protein